VKSRQIQPGNMAPRLKLRLAWLGTVKE